MGKGLVLLVFAVCFVAFVVLKLVFVGTKAAYEAVFDPGAKDQRVRELISHCMLRVSHAMHERYNGQPGQLRVAILELTPLVQSIILERGYKADAAMARAIVCSAIVAGGHASQSEIEDAQAS
jgi:hypothetical protein